MITFTEKARAKVTAFMAANNKPGAALRIIAHPSGAGFTYNFSLEDYDAEKPNDALIRDGGFVTRIDPESAKCLNGATVDWKEEAGKTGFSVLNPNSPIPPSTPEELKANILDAIKTVFDPEIPMVNIYDLGLIYDVVIGSDNQVTVRMTLTAPNCPAAEQLPSEVQMKTKAVPGVKEAKIDLVFDPPWTPEKMSESARLALGF
ncbi:MAG TPA: iron-sulfur cluster assembly protein [Bdellovibrionota bacterium]|nr:iron-sulfur cluster assembly protein [Bdellovibrionota bacterium]